MTDDTVDPFEEFKKKKENPEKETTDPEKETSDPEKEEQSADLPEDSSEDSVDLRKLLQDHWDDEERPEGYWSHKFHSGKSETDEIEEITDKKPGSFISHRLSSEEQEQLNDEARRSADRPDGFESHRMDVEEDTAEGEDDEPDNMDQSV